MRGVAPLLSSRALAAHRLRAVHNKTPTNPLLLWQVTETPCGRRARGWILQSDNGPPFHTITDKPCRWRRGIGDL